MAAATPGPMGSAASNPERTGSKPLSLAEWAALPEDEPGELVDGHLTEEEVPEYVHELVVGWLIHALWAWGVPRGGPDGRYAHALAVSEGIVGAVQVARASSWKSRRSGPRSTRSSKAHEQLLSSAGRRSLRDGAPG